MFTIETKSQSMEFGVAYGSMKERTAKKVALRTLRPTKRFKRICILSTDYVAGGELFTHLYQREHFNENEVRIYIAEIILALEQLHKVI